MKAGLAFAVVHWAAVVVWGFWGWVGVWAAVGVALLVAARVNRR